MATRKMRSRGQGPSWTSAPEAMAPTARPSMTVWLEATDANHAGLAGAVSTTKEVRLLLARPAPKPIRSRPAMSTPMWCTFNNRTQPERSRMRLAIEMDRRPR